MCSNTLQSKNYTQVFVSLLYHQQNYQQHTGYNNKESNYFQLTVIKTNKILSYRRETALQGALVFAKSRRLELGDNIVPTL